MNKTLQIKEFLNGGFRDFSRYDCLTNIPNLIDGFKVSQRKSLYTLTEKNKRNTVERYSAEIASFTSYHHGSGALCGVLVGLAQDYPTSNNVNFLTPLGQFGNILSSAAAASRYISVEPNSNYRKWFKKEDDIVLQYEYEDGERIEPKFLIPIVPTVLFNGVSGIGTGYACKIMAYNPVDIVQNVRLHLEGKKQKKLTPFYRGYRGQTSINENNQTVFTGKFERLSTTLLKVTALPIGYELESYKDELAKLIEQEVIKDYDDNSTVDGWDILIQCTRAFTANEDETIINKLKLVIRDSNNITVWDEKGKIKYFETPEDLIVYFIDIRLQLYEDRRLKQMDISRETIRWLSERLRFVMFYLDNVEKFKSKKKDDLVTLLLKNNFTDYDRLLQMHLWVLTRDEIEKLKNQVAEEKKYLTFLQSDTAKDMYLRELKELKI